MKGTLPYGVPATSEQLEEIASGIHKMRQDFSEGVIAQIPRDNIPVLSQDFNNSIIHDIRFRLNAYKYCNLLCFFRIDAEDGIRGDLDEDNVSLLLKDIGKNISADEIRRMIPAKALSLVGNVIEPNPLLSPTMTHIVQLPSIEMNSFGDIVIVIKDEEEFKHRVINAVNKTGGQCIMGDVRYHDLVDRVDPSTMSRHSMTVISSEMKTSSADYPHLSKNGSFDISILNGIDGIY